MLHFGTKLQLPVVFVVGVPVLLVADPKHQMVFTSSFVVYVGRQPYLPVLLVIE